MPQDATLYTATIKYDRPLIRRALNRYFAKRLGKPFFIVLPLLIVALVYGYLNGLWSRLLTIVTIALLVVLAFLGLVYVARLQAAEGFFDKANDPTVTLSFTDEGVKTDSDVGSSELKWSVFDELLKFPDVWLLVYAKSGYITLPVSQLTSDCAHFIDLKMSAARDLPGS